MIIISRSCEYIMLVHRGIMVHEPIGTAAPGGYWTRPADWLPLPDLSEGQEKLVGLFAVYNHDSNFVAFRCAGAYHVDWGDGTSEDVASNTTAQHRYDSDSYAALGSGTDCSRGYRQAIITVTPQAGQHLTSISLDCRHNGTAAAYATQWLDVAVVGAYLTSLRIGGTTGRLHMLEQFRLVGLHGITNMNNMFYRCYSLQSVPLFDTANVTDMSGMFYGCYSLQSVPLFNTANVTNMSGMFNECYSLVAVAALSVGAVTSITDIFGSCSSLASAPLSGTAISISYAGCNLARDEIVAIFNGLATVTGQTITITGNWGVASLTDADRKIATDKGWAIAA